MVLIHVDNNDGDGESEENNMSKQEKSQFYNNIESRRMPMP